MYTEPHLNTRGVGRIRDSYANPRRGRGFVCITGEKKHGKKSSIAFIKYFMKIIRQMKENAVYLPLDRNRFSRYALIFPTSQSKWASDNTQPIKIRVMSQPCLHTLI